MDRYKVVARLGEGAASTLYAVQDPKSKQVSALKHVEKTGEKSQRFLDQVEQEYAIGSKLDHKTIRKVRKSSKTILGGLNQIGVTLKSNINNRCQMELLVPESHDPYARPRATTNHH